MLALDIPSFNPNLCISTKKKRKKEKNQGEIQVSKLMATPTTMEGGSANS